MSQLSTLLLAAFWELKLHAKAVLHLWLGAQYYAFNAILSINLVNQSSKLISNNLLPYRLLIIVIRHL